MLFCRYGAGTSNELLPVNTIFKSTDADLKVDIQLTSENIDKLLCKNRDCPAARKFKEFGIGPLATGKGLGTIYGPTDIPISYGLSHTYGNLEHYGPYGVYTRPKRVDQPFIPRKNDDAPAEDTCECCCCQYRKQISTDCPHHKTCNTEFSHDQIGASKATNMPSNNPSMTPLRLTGGSPTFGDKARNACPSDKCNELLQEFDEALIAFRDAMMRDITSCPGSALRTTSPDMNLTTTATTSACGNPECFLARKTVLPEERQFNLLQMKSACGSPSCPNSKRLTGQADDDDCIELMLVNESSFGKSCGHPDCPFPLKPPLLEPVHWDCPELLPEGVCSNPQCPMKPECLRYTLPPRPKTCGNPLCPGRPPCPAVRACRNPNCPHASPCSNPKCPKKPSPCFIPKEGYWQPYGGKAAATTCEHPKCSFSFDRPKPDPDCGNPSCPYSVKPIVGCGDPNCPFASPEPCGNKQCPFAGEADPPESKAPDSCDNPNCPFSSVDKKPSPCYIPDRKPSPCHIPNKKLSPCYIPDKKLSPCYIPVEPCSKPPGPPVMPTISDICIDPTCPFNQPPAWYWQYYAYWYWCTANGAPCPFRFAGENNAPISDKERTEVIDECPTPPEKSAGDHDTPAADSFCVPDTCLGECLLCQGEGDACVKDTCKSTGGNIVCDICCTQGTKSAPQIGGKERFVRKGTTSDHILEKPKKVYKPPVIRMDLLYPGLYVGHRECVTPGRRVPAKMGWMWDIHVPCLGLKVSTVGSKINGTGIPSGF